MAEPGSKQESLLRRALILVFALTPILLSGSLTAPFLDFDDAEHVGNLVVLGIKPWYSVFELTSGSIFPLTILSFKCERMFFLNTLGIQNWATFARIDNLILHMVAGYFVWKILNALRFTPPWALLLTGAFLLHPMACESVCWVSERKNVLAAAFGFGAVYFAIARHNKKYLALIAVLYALAILSKPSALGLMPILLAIQFTPVRRAIFELEDGSVDADAANVPFSPIIATSVVLSALACVAFNLRSHSQMIMKPPGGSVFTALLTDAEIFRRYIQNVLCPLELSVAYAVKPIVSVLDPRFLLNAAGVAGFIALTVWLSPRRKLSVFFWFWFFACLGPVMNLVATMLLMQDRYVYLSTPALLAVTALAVQGILVRLKVSARAPHPIATAGILFLLMGFSQQRSAVWQSTYTLYGDATEKQPLSAFGQINYASALIKGADFLAQMGGDRAVIDDMRSEAVTHLQTACTLDDQERLVSPGRPYTVLALVQYERGNLDEAAELCRRVLEDKFSRPITYPNKIEVRVLLARIAMKRSEYAEALNEAQEALKVATRNDSNAGDAWLLSGQALEKLGRGEDAANAYRKIEAWMPEYAEAQARLKELHP